MKSAREVKRIEKTIAEIKMLSRVFQYAAARRIKRNEYEIQKIRDQFDKAKNIYAKVKNAAVSDKKALIQEAILTSPLRKTERGEVFVVITSETRYYGTLMSGLIDSFIDEYKKKIAAFRGQVPKPGELDVIIIGKLGQEYLQKSGAKVSNLVLHHLDDDNPDFTEVSKIIQTLKNYRKITIFYAVYVSVFKQDWAYDYLDRLFSIESLSSKSNYLYKPTVVGAVGQLEGQLVGAAFLQRLFESGLAKYAHRVRILQIGQVAERISAALDEIAKIKSTAGRDSENKRQNQLLSGSILWRKNDVVNI